MPILIKTEAFEGPMDLLYHLIEKNEIDIYDIPIALLADQYIAALRVMHRPDMESMSEFILMAATLLEIKSKMLLPAPPRADEDEPEDPRDELVRKLIEYKRFKSAAESFRGFEAQGQLVFYKQADESLPFAELYRPAIDIDELLSDVTLDALYAAFEDVMKRKELKTDKIRSSFGAVEKDRFTIEEKQAHIRNLLRLYKTVSFDEIFTPGARRMEKVVTFLALLELIKVKAISITQDALFGKIQLEELDAAALDSVVDNGMEVDNYEA